MNIKSKGRVALLQCDRVTSVIWPQSTWQLTITSDGLSSSSWDKNTIISVEDLQLGTTLYNIHYMY